MDNINVDPRIVSQIRGDKVLLATQAKGSWVNPTKSTTSEDTRLRSLTLNQRKVYDSIVSGVSGDALESSTGLTGTEVQEAIQELTSLGILRTLSAQDEARIALDQMEEARRKSVYEGGESKFQEASKRAALMLANSGELGLSEGKRLLGGEGIKSLYGGGKWSYKELLGARKISGDSLGKMPDTGWKSVTEIAKAYQPYKEKYKGSYEKSYSDWYSGLTDKEKGYVDTDPSKYRKSDEDIEKQAEEYWSGEVVPKW